MIRGLYTSALGMTVQMKRMDVVANNIANADTAGYKRDGVQTQSFSEELTKRLRDSSGVVTNNQKAIGKMSLGLFVDNIYTNFTGGNLKETGGAFNAALLGDGFFAIAVTDRDGNTTEKYTRDGSFTLNSQRELMTKDGNLVMGQNGVITVPDGDVTISDNGALLVDGELVDYIKTVNFQNSQSLRKFADNLYDVTEESNQVPFTGSVVQGYLENSNVNSVTEMVEMISLSRTYEANQKMVGIHDTILGRAVSDIGRKI